jgi:SNF2 family DNA or RNA helicase
VALSYQRDQRRISSISVLSLKTNSGDSESEATYPIRQPDNTPYNPPEPIAFPELDSDNTTERPSFDTTPPSPKEDLLLASGGIIPAPISQWLRSYQVEGVNFMYRLWKEGRGGILGDDMGLGSILSLVY